MPLPLIKIRVLDSYCAQFNFNGTPGRKRKQTTTRRWISLSDKCDEYHNESCEYQIDNLIKFLLECSEDSEDPPEPEFDGHRHSDRRHSCRCRACLAAAAQALNF